MGYNKSEKHTSPPDNKGNYKTLQGGYKGIVRFLIFIVIGKPLYML